MEILTFKKINLLFLLTIGLNCLAQQDSVYFYQNGQKDWYYLQQDIYLFSTSNNLAYSGTVDPAVVEFQVYSSEESQKTTAFHFTLNSSQAEREAQKNLLRNSALFECDYLVLTKDKMADRTQNKWVKTNRLILVVFRDPLISQLAVQAFATAYDLNVYHQPDPLLPPANWSYIFQLQENACLSETSVFLAAKIWEQDSAFVMIVEPDRSLYQPFFNNNPNTFLPDKTEINLFPNPISSESKLTFPNPDLLKYKLKVYNLMGQEVQEQETTGSGFLLSESDFSTGLYFYRLYQENALLAGAKFMVE